MHPDEIFGGYPWEHDENLLLGYRGFPWNRSVRERNDLLRKNILKEIDPFDFVSDVYEEIIKDASVLENDDELTVRRREMFYLNYYGFMQTLTERCDRMSSGNIEILVPFCDHRVVEYAYNIPWEMKKYKNREKGLLRYAFNEFLPENVAWRKKSPFPKTHNPEYLKLVTRVISEIIEKDECRITEIFDKKKIQELIKTEGAGFKKNWYGQLMALPQIFAYMIQTEYWMREWQITVDGN
jgi:asparagine synthase (glutamine-hydrolysing)